jgi:hypothetical protein
MADFPPAAPTTVQQIIPSYLYVQYNDDADLQAFVAAYNNLAQGYLDWSNQTSLAVYTDPAIAGPLLDWVGAGLYGLARPSLPSGQITSRGPFNTYVLNRIAFNTRQQLGGGTFYATTDDVYKRILTWLFYKGDGKLFNVRWLKRRIVRFLYGANGTDADVSATNVVGVTFPSVSQVNITITGVPGTIANILKSAIDAGILELPFQFSYVVTITP